MDEWYPMSRNMCDAMRETKERAHRGETMGKRKIVSMQECEAIGLVRRITRNGRIVDWDLTDAGRRWRDMWPIIDRE